MAYLYYGIFNIIVVEHYILHNNIEYPNNNLKFVLYQSEPG